MKNATSHWSVQVFRSVVCPREAFQLLLISFSWEKERQFASIPQVVSLEKETTGVTKSRKIFKKFLNVFKKKDIGNRKSN